MTDIRLSQWPETSPVYASLGSLAVAGIVIENANLDSQTPSCQLLRQ
jgi:hypothetical protein